MPNWCSNIITLSHSDPEQIKRVEAAISKQDLLNEFVPVPEALKITAGAMTADEEAQAQKNVELYGYRDWYEFCANEWGTKWEVDAEIVMGDKNSVDIGFDSAWAPPIAWYERMTDLGFTVDAYYYEQGMGFCGHWCEGDDDYYNVPDNSQDTLDTIPRDIDEMFSISANQYEWEQENREDLQAWIEDAVEAKEESNDHAG